MAGRTPFTNVDPATAANLRRLGFDPHEVDRATEQLLTYICAELLPAPPVSGAPSSRSSIFSRLLITEAAHDPAIPISADRISLLPDALLRNIVSRLPVADAARTAVLAPRWRRVWLSTEPGLIDAFLRPEAPTVTAAVSGILEAHPGPFRRVHLTRSHMGAHQAQLARWLQLLAAKGVHDLVLVNRPWPCDVPLPATLFSITSLVRLYIGLWKLPDTAGLRGAAFPHLRELGICTVAMEQGDVESIVASSPVLEVLSIQGSHKGLRLRLVSQSLRCVQICSSVVENVTVVKAPCLERLILQGGRHAASGLCARVSILDAPKLHSFGFLEPGNHILEIGDTIIMAGIKESPATIVASVKILSLNVRFGVPNEARMVPMFLKCFPNVVRLHIMSRKCSRSTGKLSLNFQEGPTERAMLHIKEMYFREFRGEQGEVAFLKSIFPKVLETAVIIMANPSFTPFSVAAAFSKLKEATEVIRCCQVLLLGSTCPEGGKAWSFKEVSDFSCEDPFSAVESGLVPPEQSKFIGFDEVGNRHDICFTMPVRSGRFLDVRNYDASMELVDCDGTDNGCEGGLMDNAFEFVVNNGGLATEADYPYTGADGGSCGSSTAAATITGHEDVPANDEASLLKAVAAQPVSLAVDGGDNLFRFYKGGVLSGDCGTKLDHGIAAVGYGVAGDGTKFWVMKNSWGAGWGEDGFIRMERDVADEKGLCGLAMQPSYPTA